MGAIHLRPPTCIIDSEDTGGASSSHMQAPPAASRHVAVPRTSALALNHSDQAAVMAKMFVASMHQQQFLMDKMMGMKGIHIFHGSHNRNSVICLFSDAVVHTFR